MVEKYEGKYGETGLTLGVQFKILHLPSVKVGMVLSNFLRENPKAVRTTGLTLN